MSKVYPFIALATLCNFNVNHTLQTARMTRPYRTFWFLSDTRSNVLTFDTLHEAPWHIPIRSF